MALCPRCTVSETIHFVVGDEKDGECTTNLRFWHTREEVDCEESNVHLSFGRIRLWRRQSPSCFFYWHVVDQKEVDRVTTETREQRHETVWFSSGIILCKVLWKG